MLETELDLVVLFGSLIVARAKKELIELLYYIQQYKQEELAELWSIVNNSLSTAEQHWLTSVLQESING